MADNGSLVELLDYRRRVWEIYANLRNSDLPREQRWLDFRAARDNLFTTHPQSALTPEQKANFSGLSYFPYDTAWRFVLRVDTDVEPHIIEVDLEEDGLFNMQRVGKVHFDVNGEGVSLSLFWILGYGGGLFLPFRDATAQTGESYGGGRYLLDTIKGADLGTEGDKLILDFNYAYNPSCAYNPRWHCPLPPKENWLDLSVPVGERAYQLR